MQHVKRLAIFVAIVLWVGQSPSASGEVRVPHIFGDHMVLQRGRVIPVWGWADPGEQVRVQLGEVVVEVETPQNGQWSTNLPAREAGGPLTMTISGSNKITYSDVLIGDVWLCSGQSNMEFTVGGCNNAERERAEANFPKIRHIKIPRIPASVVQDDVDAQWTVCSPETVGSYTAVGYFFGRHLQRELGVPIGLVNSSWGGTRIEPWTPPCGFAAVQQLADIWKQVQLTDPASPLYQRRLDQYLQSLQQWIGKAKSARHENKLLEPAPAYPDELKPLTSHQSPTTLYNGMIHPLVPYAIQGAIWYQGESNHSEGMLYFEKMKALIAGWREVWAQPELPFYYVQIAPYQYGEESPTIVPQFWEAQAKALEIPGTGMAVIHDIGNLRDIHPRNKQDVGRRLALIALAKTYGKSDVVYSGPTFQSLSLEGDKLRVTFDHVGSGLVSRDGKPLNWFEIVGPETDFTDAVATIDGDSVLLSASGVRNPVAVRFAWNKLAEPNLANKEGLPAVPFRAGEVPQRDWLALKVAESKQYELVYDLDLSNLDQVIKYDVDNTSKVKQPFDRVAYFLELQRPGESVQYVYAAMDAFTDDPSQLGIPTVASRAVFQQNVENLTVLSNVDGIETGTNMAGGNLEFWPNNYSAVNAKKVPGASDSIWDFGDRIEAPSDGHGCMQIHNHRAGQTVMAINHWRAGAGASMGIGNSTGQTRDWTFVGNAGSYEVKRLRILIRPRR